MKTAITLAVAFLALVLLPPSVEADTLKITAGSITHNQSLAPLALFSGAGFSVQAIEAPSSDGFLLPAFGVSPFTWTMSLFTSFAIQVGSETCHASEGVPPGCGGLLTLTSPGFAMPTDWPPGTLFVGTVPFTADGFLVINGTQYDLHGEGTVTGNRCLDLSKCGIVVDPGSPQFLIGAKLTYNFTVPELPSLLTLLTGVVIMVGMALVRGRVV